MTRCQYRFTFVAFLLGLLAFLMSLASCGGSGSGANATSGTPSPNSSGSSGSSGAGGQSTVVITIPQGAMSLGSKAFQPNPADVEPGMTVTWMNKDTIAHTATSDTGVFDSGNIAPGASWSWQVPQDMNGQQLSYHCTIHPTMTGTLQIGGASTTGSSGSGNECLGMPDGTPCNGETCAKACSGPPACASRVYFYCQSNSCQGKGILCMNPLPTPTPTP